VAEGIPFDNSTFDAVFAGEIIEHMHDTDFFIDELYRILKPQGQLVLTTPNLVYYGNAIKILLKRQLYWVDYNNTFGHVKYYTPISLKDHLTSRGFQVSEMKTVGDIFLDMRTEWIRNTELGKKLVQRIQDFIFLAFPLRGQNLITHAKKIIR